MCANACSANAKISVRRSGLSLLRTIRALHSANSPSQPATASFARRGSVTRRNLRFLLCPIPAIAAFLVSILSLAQTQTSPAVDGPAELPRLHVATSLASTPAPGKKIKITDSSQLQPALNRAGCGDTIELEAGVTFEGNFKLPSRSCDDAHWIILRTSAPDSSLPPEGTRLTPCYAGILSLHEMPLPCIAAQNVMAKIVGQPPILASDGANHYRFLGLELTQIPGKLAYSILNLSTADHIIVDRCWIHGTSTDDSQQGVHFSSSYLAVVDSFISDIHFNGADSQAIGGAGGTGPYAIVNNYLEGAGENVMFGGAAATTTPSDIEILRNHFYKPLSWRPDDPSFAGTRFTVKDLFEIKNAQRVLVAGNIFENMWGTAVVITPKNQNGKCPICTASDITWRDNIVRHAGNAFSVVNAVSDQGDVAQPARRVSVHDNLFVDINGDKWHADGRLFFIGSCPRCPILSDVSIRHNTATEGPRNFLFVYNPARHSMPRIVFAGNLVPEGKYGIVGCGPNVFIILGQCLDAPVFIDNLIVGAGRRDYPKGQISAPDWGALKLTSAGDQSLPYALPADSRYSKPGYDGAPPGADIDAIARAIAGVDQWNHSEEATTSHDGAARFPAKSQHP